jgi:hypothetical protein
VKGAVSLPGAASLASDTCKDVRRLFPYAGCFDPRVEQFLLNRQDNYLAISGALPPADPTDLLHNMQY